MFTRVREEKSVKSVRCNVVMFFVKGIQLFANTFTPVPSRLLPSPPPISLPSPDVYLSVAANRM